MENRFRFRAWEKEGKIMIQDFLDFAVDEAEANLINVWKMNCYQIMQCIGRKDNNGKLIYEGDIIVDEDSKEKLIHAILFRGCSFGACQKKYWFKQRDFGFWIPKEHQARNFRIIGNKYENPELLKNNEN